MDDPWVRLEADLALQAAGIAAVEADATRADLVRAERAAVTMLDRLRAGLGSTVAARVGANRVAGVLADVGADHVRLRTRGGDVWLSTDAATRWEGLGRGHAPASRAAAGWTLAAVLRRLCTDRETLALHLRDGEVVTGRPDRVGRDHVDLARDGGVGPRVVTVPIAAVALLRREIVGR